MSGTIDRRYDSDSIGGENRKKFMDRNKERIKDSVKDIVDRYDVKDITKQRKIKLKSNSTDEPSYSIDRTTGDKRYVGNSNKRYQKGDTVAKQGKAPSKGGFDNEGEDGEHDFIFELTRQELVQYVFADMELPDFIKQGIAGDYKTKLQREGFTTEGIPGKLNVKKTVETSMARRIAYKGSLARRLEAAETEEEKEEIRNKKIPFIDETDLRYNRYEERKFPIKKAAVVMLMDVSGSMGEDERRLAKMFFLLLYVFLDSHYEAVELRFITYTATAVENTEEEFFNDYRSGSTSVLAGLNKAHEVLSEYDATKTNLYLAHATDGDLFLDEEPACESVLVQKILPVVQYLAYVEVAEGRGLYYGTTVGKVYKQLTHQHPNMGMSVATKANEIFPALRNLFRRK